MGDNIPTGFAYVDPIDSMPWWKKALMVGLGAVAGPGSAEREFARRRAGAAEDAWRAYVAMQQQARLDEQAKRDDELERARRVSEAQSAERLKMDKEQHAMTQFQQLLNAMQHADTGPGYTPPPTMIGDIPSQSAEMPPMGNPPIEIPGRPGETITVPSYSEREWSRRQEKLADRAERASERAREMFENKQYQAERDKRLDEERDRDRALQNAQREKEIRLSHELSDTAKNKATASQVNLIERVTQNQLNDLRKEYERRNAPQRDAMGRVVPSLRPMSNDEYQKEVERIKLTRRAQRANLGLDTADEVPSNPTMPGGSSPFGSLQPQSTPKFSRNPQTGQVTVFDPSKGWFRPDLPTF